MTVAALLKITQKSRGGGTEGNEDYCLRGRRHDYAGWWQHCGEINRIHGSCNLFSIIRDDATDMSMPLNRGFSGS